MAPGEREQLLALERAPMAEAAKKSSAGAPLAE
jgi:hypothetical protein